MLKAVHKLANSATWIMCVGAGLALVAMALHVFIDLIATKFFHAPINGTHVIVTRYYMVTLVFLPLAYAELRGAHITADLFYSSLPVGGQRLISVLNQFLLATYLGLFTWQVTVKAISQTQRGEEQIFAGVHFLIWPSRWILVLGLFAMMLAALLRLTDRAFYGLDDDDTQTGAAQ